MEHIPTHVLIQYNVYNLLSVSKSSFNLYFGVVTSVRIGNRGRCTTQRSIKNMEVKCLLTKLSAQILFSVTLTCEYKCVFSTLRVFKV